MDEENKKKTILYITVPMLKRKNKTLKQRINQHVFNQGDICCTEDIDKKTVIEEIFSLYREIAMSPDEYLDSVNNDLLVFVGYKVDLEKRKDVEGVQLWNKINRNMLTNKQLDETKIIKLMKDLPLYYLLAFLGNAYYKLKVKQALDLEFS